MNEAKLPLDAVARIDDACDRFEAKWQTPEPPRLEEFLGDATEPERSALLRGLLEVELAYRRRRNETPAQADYHARFPEFDTVVAGVFGGALTTPNRVLGADPPAPSLPGYEILERLGRGGMGVVYKARHQTLGRTVALKMILAGAQADAEERRRFRREAEAVARLQHPNIVSIYEVSEHEGRPYIAFEYVSGGGLDKKLNGAPQPPRAAAELMLRVTRAIQAAHEQGILHRDLKPANVLLAADGTPKIADFGLARPLDSAATIPTRTGAVLGTPSYMAPEQASGDVKQLSPATDVYALGATLYELLTGRPPFRGSNVMALLEEVCLTRPEPPRSLAPQTPRELEAICMKCLEKHPLDRYASAAALADDLERYLAGEPVQAGSFNFMQRLARVLGRSHLDSELGSWAGVLFLFAGVVLVGQGVVFWIMRDGLPWSVLVVTRVVQAILMVGGLFWFRGGRLLPRNLAERQLWSVWGGYLLCCTYAAIANRFLIGQIQTDQPSFYPIWTAIAGFGFFALGGSYWGWCYAIGMAFFLLAVAMAWHITYAPLTFGVLWAIALAVMGWRLRLLEREAKSRG